MKSTSEDFAGDVLAGIAFLKTRGEINGTRIGLLGHSEGGIIAPLVASRSPDVAFIVFSRVQGFLARKSFTCKDRRSSKPWARTKGL